MIVDLRHEQEQTFNPNRWSSWPSTLSDSRATSSRPIRRQFGAFTPTQLRCNLLLSHISWESSISWIAATPGKASSSFPMVRRWHYSSIFPSWISICFLWIINLVSFVWIFKNDRGFFVFPNQFVLKWIWIEGETVNWFLEFFFFVSPWDVKVDLRRELLECSRFYRVSI